MSAEPLRSATPILDRIEAWMRQHAGARAVEQAEVLAAFPGERAEVVRLSLQALRKAGKLSATVEDGTLSYLWDEKLRPGERPLRQPEPAAPAGPVVTGGAPTIGKKILAGMANAAGRDTFSFSFADLWKFANGSSEPSVRFAVQQLVKDGRIYATGATATRRFSLKPATAVPEPSVQPPPVKPEPSVPPVDASEYQPAGARPPTGDPSARERGTSQRDPGEGSAASPAAGPARLEPAILNAQGGSPETAAHSDPLPPRAPDEEAQAAVDFIESAARKYVGLLPVVNGPEPLAAITADGDIVMLDGADRLSIPRRHVRAIAKLIRRLDSAGLLDG